MGVVALGDMPATPLGSGGRVSLLAMVANVMPRWWSLEVKFGNVTLEICLEGLR